MRRSGRTRILGATLAICTMAAACSGDGETSPADARTGGDSAARPDSSAPADNSVARDGGGAVDLQPIPPWVGNWRFSGQTCTLSGENIGFVQTGVARTTLVLDETKGTTIIVFTSGCTVTMKDYLITPVGDGSFTFPTSTSEEVICNPNPCTGQIVTTIGGESFTQNPVCPTDYPPTAGGLGPGRVEGNFLRASVDLGQGVVCTLTYARDV